MRKHCQGALASKPLPPNPLPETERGSKPNDASFFSPSPLRGGGWGGGFRRALLVGGAETGARQPGGRAEAGRAKDGRRKRRVRAEGHETDVPLDRFAGQLTPALPLLRRQQVENLCSHAAP